MEFAEFQAFARRQGFEITPEQAAALQNSPQAQQLAALLAGDGGQTMQAVTEALQRGDTARVRSLLEQAGK